MKIMYLYICYYCNDKQYFSGIVEMGNQIGMIKHEDCPGYYVPVVENGSYVRNKKGVGQSN